MLSIWWASIVARSFPMAVVLGVHVQGFIFHHRIWVARPPGGQTPEGGQTGWPDRSPGVGSWLLERLQIAGCGCVCRAIVVDHTFPSASPHVIQPSTCSHVVLLTMFTHQTTIPMWFVGSQRRIDPL